jgi:5-methylcytosine-specific restriction endonuclease McrA
MSVHSSRGRAWDETRILVLDRDNWTCQACGKPLIGTDATVDHVIPKSKGGSDDLWNLISLCRKDNSTKGATIAPRINYYNPAWLDHI